MNAHETPVRHDAMRIGGEKITTDDVIEIRYPYTDAVIGTVPAGQAEHAARAFEIAAAYRPSLTRYERQQILFRAAELIRARRDEIAHWLTLELGICHQHALYETGRSYDVFTLAGQLAILDDGQIFSCALTPQGKDRKIYTKREPVGAISAITPFNHPLNMVAHKIAPAIAVGCTAIVKPAPETPLTALAIAELAHRAGIPAGVINIITGDAPAIGGEMTANPLVRAIGFTGSTEVGKLLMRQAADTVSALMADALASEDGAFLGGCYAAESFLSTWQDELPFGRPLAP